MWMCVKTDDDGNDSADVAFGKEPKFAYKNYCDNIRDDIDVSEMTFYELSKCYEAEVTWTIKSKY
jgi:hypothetical protein